MRVTGATPGACYVWDVVAASSAMIPAFSSPTRVPGIPRRLSAAVASVRSTLADVVANPLARTSAMTPRKLTLLARLWPPFAGAGIRVDRVSADFHEIDVSLRLSVLNKNVMGAHFGGSLYAMTDPFLMVMLQRILGDGFVVWDKAAEIQFVRPGRETVFARFVLSREAVGEIRQASEAGPAITRDLRVRVTTASGQPVALVKKTLYVRRKTCTAIEGVRRVP